jgi:hypothetical protein
MAAPSTGPREEFVSEPLVPTPGAFDTAAMSRGEPGLPREFTWRGKTYAIARVIAAWKSTGKDRGETYLRRHWYTIELTRGGRMTVYCERQAKPGRNPKSRWWVYSVAPTGTL